jgi:hypothetical protein
VAIKISIYRTKTKPTQAPLKPRPPAKLPLTPPPDFALPEKRGWPLRGGK